VTLRSTGSLVINRIFGQELFPARRDNIAWLFKKKGTGLLDTMY